MVENAPVSDSVVSAVLSVLIVSESEFEVAVLAVGELAFSVLAFFESVTVLALLLLPFKFLDLPRRKCNLSNQDIALPLVLLGLKLIC